MNSPTDREPDSSMVVHSPKNPDVPQQQTIEKFFPQARKDDLVSSTASLKSRKRTLTSRKRASNAREAERLVDAQGQSAANRAGAASDDIACRNSKKSKNDGEDETAAPGDREELGAENVGVQEDADVVNLDEFGPQNDAEIEESFGARNDAKAKEEDAQHGNYVNHEDDLAELNSREGVELEGQARTWTIEGEPKMCKVEQVSGGFKVAKTGRTGWNCCFRGSFGWDSGVHEWTIRMAKKSAVSFGVAQQPIRTDEPDANVGIRYDLYCDGNEAVGPDGTGDQAVFPDRKRICPPNKVSIRLDMESGSVTYGLNGVMNSRPTFEGLDRNKKWFPYFAVSSQGCEFFVSSGSIPGPSGGLSM